MSNNINIAIQFLQAAAGGDVSAIKNFIKAGIKPNDIHTNEGHSALWYSVKGQHPAVSWELLKAGANPNFIFAGEPILYSAIFAQDIAHVTLLLEYGANLQSDSKSPIALAAAGKDISPIRHEIYELIMSYYSDNLEKTHKERQEKFIESLQHPQDLQTALKQYTALQAQIDKSIQCLQKQDAAADFAQKCGLKNILLPRDPDNEFEVVVARYNEDLRPLIQEFPTEKVTVYNKGKKNLDYLPDNFEVFDLPNVGRETHTYFHHVVTNYNSLAKRTLLMQGDPFDHNNIYTPFSDYKTAPITSCPNLIGKCMWDTLGNQSDELKNTNWNETKWHDIVLRNRTMLEFAQQKIDPSLTANSRIYFQWGAQFAVDRDNILCNPIEYHMQLRDTLVESRHPIEVHEIERLWNEWAKCKTKPVVAAESLDDVKIYVINLERSVKRREDMIKQLDAAGIKYEIFNAVDGYKVKIKNLKTNEEFSGQDIRNGTAKIEKSLMYIITCDPENESPAQFYYSGSTKNSLNRGASAGELGVLCSNFLIWKGIEKHHKKAIIFEDDLVFKKNFKLNLEKFIAHVPETFDLAFIDLNQYKGTQYHLIGNEYVNSFGKGSGAWGAYAVMYSNKAVKTLLSSPCYSYTVDDFFWSVISNDVYKLPECIDQPLFLEAYASSYDLLDVTINGSVICEMGRDFLGC